MAARRVRLCAHGLWNGLWNALWNGLRNGLWNARWNPLSCALWNGLWRAPHLGDTETDGATRVPGRVQHLKLEGTEWERGALVERVELLHGQLTLLGQPLPLERVAVETRAVLSPHLAQPWEASMGLGHGAIDHRDKRGGDEAAGVVKVIVRRDRTHQLHLVRRRDRRYAARIPAGVDGVALTSRLIADKVDEIFHLAGSAEDEALLLRAWLQRNVAPRQQLSKPHAALERLLRERAGARDLGVLGREGEGGLVRGERLVKAVKGEEGVALAVVCLVPLGLRDSACTRRRQRLRRPALLELRLRQVGL